MRLALEQINTTVGDLEGNAAKVAEACRRAVARGADLVVFPEMTLTGYPPEDLLFKEHFIRDNVLVLRRLASEIRAPVAVVGFVDRDRKGRLHNAAALLSEGRVRGVYRKHHLPNYGVFDEKRYFSAGESFLMMRLGPWAAALTICEDVWRKEGPFQEAVRRGAHLLVNLSASPYDCGKAPRREALLRRRARQGRCWIAYANLVGGQDELVFDGGSLVVDPAGRVIASGRRFVEDEVICDIPLPRKRGEVSPGGGEVSLPPPRVQTAPLSPLSAPDLEPIEEIRQALILGVRDYVRKNGFESVVVGLSGGIDSSVVAALARAALGKGHVVGVSMPSSFTSRGTRGDARRLAEALGIRFLELPIEGIAGAYEETLAPVFAGRPRDVTEENIQARVRGNLLMAMSNKFGWLVLTTGNKSEIAVGYCTLYGDMSGGFAVLKDVPKTVVYALAERINLVEGGVIPRSVIERPPSAELRPGQKDQDSLPPYEILDELIKGYVEEHRSLAELTHIASAGTAAEIVARVDRSEYKRRQAPPGIKITPRAFGKDWRLPITNRYREALPIEGL